MLIEDTHVIMDAIKSHPGWSADVEYYGDDQQSQDKLRNAVRRSDAYISRIDPGIYDNYTESKYHQVWK